MGEIRRAYSEQRLIDLEARLAPLFPALEEHPLCVYATGSYGRREAWSGSDIDLFFLYDGSDDTQRFPWTTFVRLSARLIDAIETMGFPPFSGDGRYLEVLYVHEMELVLGSPRDDSLNAFTARMLLLLESKLLHDQALYDRLLARIVGFYYRDYADHMDDFFPGFLINDILRFWRTLTLNYEHNRRGLADLTGPELDHRKAKSALKNYKLKFSRLATCFSMIANLGAEVVPVQPETVLTLCHMAPAERFDRLRGRGKQADDIVTELMSLYDGFLEFSQRDEDLVLADLADHGRRDHALDEAARYGDLIYALLVDVLPAARMRYLVI
jgi:hypothetical protein